MPHVDADIDAIHELEGRIRALWAGFAAQSREELSGWLQLLRSAAGRRETDSKQVREALQRVLLIVGTGALATLGEATRQRLAALTGITLEDTDRRRHPFDGPSRRWRGRLCTVVILGKRGVGKSSTLNYLFKFDRPTDAAVECTTAPYSRRIHAESGLRYRIVDMPGIAANGESLAKYGKYYRRWLARADTVVWITQANVRAYKQDQLFWRDYSTFVRPTTRLVLAISKADTQAGELTGESAPQSDLLRRKAEDIVAEIVPYTWARPESVMVVPYSTTAGWNTEQLRSAVLAI